jgi:hypothetical protein
MAILGICLIFMTQILVQESVVERRTASQTAALRLLEAHAELLRAGLPLPDEEGRFAMELLVEPPADSGIESPRLEFDLVELEPDGLWSLDLEMSYEVAGQGRLLSVEMRLWRP